MIRSIFDFKNLHISQQNNHLEIKVVTFIN